MMRRSLVTVLVAVLLAATLTTPAHARWPSFFSIFGLGRGGGGVMGGATSRPMQTAEIPGLTPILAAQKCANWSWAASLESVLASQDVLLKQNDFLTRADGGEICKDAPSDFDTLAKATDGEYRLADGRKVRLETRNITGAPTATDDLIAALRLKRPLIFFWSSHAYLVQGVSYVEMIGANGHRMFAIQELKLLDPLERAPEKQAVSFVRGKDNVADIDGVMDVVVTPIEGSNWLHPEKELEHPTEIYFPK